MKKFRLHFFETFFYENLIKNQLLVSDFFFPHLYFFIFFFQNRIDKNQKIGQIACVE